MSISGKFLGGFLIAVSLSVFATLRVVASKTATTEDVLRVLYKQSQAWNKGDLSGFLEGYLHSEDITFVSGGTELKGFDALKQRYEKKYGNSKETMGTLSFYQLETRVLGKRNALCIGHWKVERAKGSPLEGMFSLVLVRTGKDEWRIIHDHTSMAETK